MCLVLERSRNFFNSRRVPIESKRKCIIKVHASSFTARSISFVMTVIIHHHQTHEQNQRILLLFAFNKISKCNIKNFKVYIKKNVYTNKIDMKELEAARVFRKQLYPNHKSVLQLYSSLHRLTPAAANFLSTIRK